MVDIVYFVYFCYCYKRLCFKLCCVRVIVIDYFWIVKIIEIKIRIVFNILIVRYYFVCY